MLLVLRRDQAHARPEVIRTASNAISSMSALVR